ncbi:MAG: tRNA (N6-isopentenyl adenosine(37)-C2)-methylthiotransferase MiaB [Candidatus Cloacimonetes bacterium]|nr:tRNA (N6-isopentenyl adenosine(37)-C2)-methylthiotransferase MiaB [Candidatus Cloacimonadota bacterium]
MKFIVKTYGCQMNVADSELIISILQKSGFSSTDKIEEADIIIFNTCSVRENAESRVIGRISNEVSRKTTNKDLLIGIVGCMAQRLGDELKKINKKIDFIVGVDQYSKLPEIIEVSRQKVAVETTFNTTEIYENLFPTRSNNLNAFVTIMRGCNNFCTYCIVPYTRGRERSRSVTEIYNEIEQAGREGLKDVTLLGQNVNSYLYIDYPENISQRALNSYNYQLDEMPMGERYDFADLLRKVNEIKDIKRLRFITSHPKDLSDKLINTMAECDKVCEHIHLPLQSGNNEVLQKMNRNYTIDHYMSLIHKLRSAMPNIAITTDIIAGFPGETEEQFDQTLQIVRAVQFDFAFMFKYSERSGTKACDFPDTVPEKVRLERLQRLIDLQTEITTLKYKQRIGNIEEVYVECQSKRESREMSGKTRDFKITVFEGDDSLIGKFVNVKITDAVGWTLKGEIVQCET